MIAERASLYSILGLKELEADNETIKEAFRGKMLKWHPDK
jgi:curved DNA-binding protein CbpA